MDTDRLQRSVDATTEEEDFWSEEDIEYDELFNDHNDSISDRDAIDDTCNIAMTNTTPASIGALLEEFVSCKQICFAGLKFELLAL